MAKATKRLQGDPKNLGPLQSALVTAVAAATAISKFNIFRPLQAAPAPPPPKKKRDPKKKKGIRREAPVYSMPSPLKRGEAWGADPYEIKEKKVKLVRIRRSVSGSDWNGRRTRESSGGAMGPKPKYHPAYDYLLMDTNAVKGKRTSKQISVRNRTMDEVNKQMKVDMKKGTKHKSRKLNNWETPSVECLPAAPELDVFERRDASGRSMPPRGSWESSERIQRHTNKHPESTSRHRKQRDESNKKKYRNHARNESGEAHQQEVPRRHMSRSKPTKNELSSASSEECAQRRKNRKHKRLNITRSQGGSTSTLGRDDMFQPDYYPAAPPLNIEIREAPSTCKHVKSSKSESPRTRGLSKTKRRQEKEIEFRELDKKEKRSTNSRMTISIEKSPVRHRDGMEDDLDDDDEVEEREKKQTEKQDREITPSANQGTALDSKSPAVANPSLTKTASVASPMKNTWLHQTLSQAATMKYDSTPIEELKQEASRETIVKTHWKDFAPSPRRDSVSAFTIREVAFNNARRESICHLDKKWEAPKSEAKNPNPAPDMPKSSSPASFFEKAEKASDKPRKVKPWMRTTLRGEGGAQNDEESKPPLFDVTKWQDIASLWTEIFYEEPSDNSEGRPLFSFIPIVGHPLFGEDKWAKKNPQPPAENPPTKFNAAPFWWLKP